MIGGGGAGGWLVELGSLWGLLLLGVVEASLLCHEVVIVTGDRWGFGPSQQLRGGASFTRTPEMDLLLSLNRCGSVGLGAVEETLAQWADLVGAPCLHNMLDVWRGFLLLDFLVQWGPGIGSARATSVFSGQGVHHWC